MFAGHPATRTLPLLERLDQAGLLASMYGGIHILWEARVVTDPHHWWPAAVQAGRTTGLTPIPNVDGCPPDTLVFMADELIDQVAHGPGLLSARGLQSLGEPLLAELAKRPNLPPRLALGVAIHLYNNEGRRDYARLAAQMTGPLHPEDIRLLAADLEKEVGWTHHEPWEQDWVHLARAASYFESFPVDETWHLDLPVTDLSQPLAEAIINACQPGSLPDTPGRIESLLWALCVLTKVPSACVLDTLLAWQSDRWVDVGPAPWNSPEHWIDWASLTAVVNSLDWTALVVEARRDIGTGQRLGRAGGILATAAEIWSTQFDVRPSERHRMSADDALDLWLEGLALQLQHGSGGFPHSMWMYPMDGASEGLLTDCAIAVLNLIGNRTDPIATSARIGAERALAGAGALAHFYGDVAIKVPTETRISPGANDRPRGDGLEWRPAE